MKKASGFTLIELIVVIVVLGILAVTAIPKFMDVQKEARVATLQAVGGAVGSANGIVYGQAAINGAEKKSKHTLEVDGEKIKILKGNAKATVKNFDRILDTDMHRIDASDFNDATHGDANSDKTAVVFMFEQHKELDDVPSYKDIKKLNKCHLVAYNHTVEDEDDGNNGKINQSSFRLKTKLVTKGC